MEELQWSSWSSNIDVFTLLNWTRKFADIKNKLGYFHVWKFDSFLFFISKGTVIPSSTVAISLLCVWPLRLALSPKGGYTVRPLTVHIRRVMVPTCIHHRGVPAHHTWSLRSLQWERWTGSQSTAVIQWRWWTKPMVTHPVIISDAISLKVVLAVWPRKSVPNYFSCILAEAHTYK